MKQTIYKLGFLCSLGITVLSYAQTGRVGINTETPKATLNVKSKVDNGKNLILENKTGNHLVTVLDDGKVGIGTETPTAKLEVKGSVKIIDGTQGAGKVLTSDANGEARWETINQTVNVNNFNTFSISSVVDPNILGYIPSSTATAQAAPNTIQVGDIYAHKLIGSKYKDHSYAIFVASDDVNWYDAYYAAKDMGGYLATFTTDDEWAYVDTLLGLYTEFETTGAWIGMARFEWYAGPAFQPNPEMKWITGEQPRHEYYLRGNKSVRKSNWFAMQQSNHNQNEPNNLNNSEGFVHTWPKNKGVTKTVNGYTSNHPWNDIASDPKTANISVKAFIVEFQQ